jgi:1-acyl-sn-glycerol-3-phosphate acyltransferase
VIVLRSVLFNLYFFGLTFVMAVAGVFVRLFAPRRTLEYARFWVRLMMAGLRRICGIYPVLTGEENLPQHGPALIASQHQSAYDTLIWLILLPRPTYVLKKELQRIPLFGPLTRLGGMIAIDRHAGPAALRSLLRQTAQAVADGRQIIIFPEGTRTAPGEQRPLQPGVAAMAAATGLPVIPVVTDSGLHWGKRAFRKLPGPIRIAVLAPIEPGLKREELMCRLAAAFRNGPVGAGDNSVDSARKIFPDRNKQDV